MTNENTTQETTETEPTMVTLTPTELNNKPATEITANKRVIINLGSEGKWFGSVLTSKCITAADAIVETDGKRDFIKNGVISDSTIQLEKDTGKEIIELDTCSIQVGAYGKFKDIDPYDKVALAALPIGITKSETGVLALQSNFIFRIPEKSKVEIQNGETQSITEGNSTITLRKGGLHIRTVNDEGVNCYLLIKIR